MYIYILCITMSCICIHCTLAQFAPHCPVSPPQHFRVAVQGRKVERLSGASLDLFCNLLMGQHGQNLWNYMKLPSLG